MGVGVAGLVLGGGIGFSQRRHGLTCDQMIETEIVTAAGELVVCNKDQNPDLFWACRGGGGGNFGVNVSFTFESFPVDVMTVFKLGWTDHLDELLPAALDLLPTTPDRLGCKLSGTPLELELLGQLVGTEAELRALLAPLYRIGAPGEEIISTLSYWDAQGILAEDENDQFTHERSRYAFKSIPAEGSRTFLDFLRKWPGSHDSAVWKMFLAGGAVASVAPAATAFVHRKALMLTAVDSIGRQKMTKRPSPATRPGLENSTLPCSRSPRTRATRISLTAPRPTTCAPITGRTSSAWLRSSASMIPTICFVLPKASRPRFEHEKAERSGT
jgi:hypothetical protein